MAYKYTTGSVERGDIYNQNDAQGNTYLDWSEDALGIVTGGSTTLVVSASAVGIGTESPQALLHITGNLDPVLLVEDGNIHLSGTNPSHNPEIQFIDNAHIGVAGLKIRYNNSTGNSHIENVYDSDSAGIFFATREGELPMLSYLWSQDRSAFITMLRPMIL